MFHDPLEKGKPSGSYNVSALLSDSLFYLLTPIFPSTETKGYKRKRGAQTKDCLALLFFRKIYKQIDRTKFGSFQEFLTAGQEWRVLLKKKSEREKCPILCQ